MQKHLENLQNLRANNQEKESQRTLLSKEAQLISEAEGLGNALGSHPLNSLTQRYSAYKRTQNEYNNCKKLLLDKSKQYEKQMAAYRDCLEAISTNKIAEQLMELKELLDVAQTQSPTREFDIVKEFLENSAQMAIYLQSCQTSNELNVTIMQQFAMVKQSFETLMQYGAVLGYHSVRVHGEHRFNKYSEWAKYLVEHQSVEDCRAIVAQFQTTIGKNAVNNVPLQQVATFSYHIQNNIRDGQFKLQKLLEFGSDINSHITQFKQVYEEHKATIANFLREGQTTGAMLALQCIVLPMVCDLNKRILMMGSAAANSAENLVELTFNGKWFMDEMIINSTIIFDLVNIIDTADREYKHMRESPNQTNFRIALSCFSEIQNVYAHLYNMNNVFATDILSDLIRGVMAEDESVLSMIKTVMSLQDGIQHIPELLSNLNLHLRRTALSSKSTSISPILTASLEGSTSEAGVHVKELQHKFGELKEQFAGNNTTGSRLFSKFFEMFESLSDRQEIITESIRKLTVSPDWEKIDQIKEAKELAVSYWFFVFCKNNLLNT